MLVHARSRNLVLNLRDPAPLLDAIPHAKEIEVRGVPLYAVPHREDEVRLLRNLGIRAPAPVNSYYDYGGRFKPFAHQRETVGFLTTNPRAYVLSGMGTGKTICALWAYDHLRKTGAVRKALVVSPLSTLVPAWGREVFLNFPHLDYAVLHGDARKRLLLLEADEHDIYIINHDGIKNARVLDALCAKENIDLVIIDELASFRNKPTKRWRAMDRIVNGKRVKGAPDSANPRRAWVWGLTGTPIPNAPTDAFGQCALITPERVPTAFGRFRDKVMTRVTQFKWVPKDDALSKVHEAMQPAIRYALRDCVDLPPTTYIDREAAMTAEQSKAYSDMVKNLVAVVNNKELTAMNEAVLLGRLLQIGAGCSYSPKREFVPLDFGPRMDVALEAMAEAESKIIVFVPYTGALLRVADAVKKHYSVETLYGNTSRLERDRIIGAFQSERAPHVLVANPAAMSHGLTLTEACTIIWFSPVHSNEIWEQANGRIVRTGQVHNTRIVCLQGSKAEAKVYDTLRKRGRTQGLLLDMVRYGEV